MKKVALSLLAFGLIGAGAFAQAAAPTVTIGDWGRQVVAFGSGNAPGNSGYWAALGSSWGNPGARFVGLNIQAKTDTVGFSITPDDDNGTFGLTDQNKAWINPIPGLTIESGINLETDTWRGSDGFGSWNFLRFAQENGDNVTFSRIGNGGYGADVNYNKDGVGLWAATYFSSATGNAQNNAFQVGGAYTIAGIGQLKAQAIGYDAGAEGNATGSSDANLFGSTKGIKGSNKFTTYQVAFNLSAVKDLSEEVGLQLPSAKADAGYTYQVSSITGYTMDKTTLHLEVIAVNYSGDNASTYAGKTVSGLALGGGVGLDYDLGNTISFNGDVRYRNALAANGGTDKTSAGKSADAFTGFSLGINKGFSNGRLGLAFEYASKGYGFAFGNSDTTTGSWAVPLVLEESF